MWPIMINLCKNSLDAKDINIKCYIQKATTYPVYINVIVEKRNFMINFKVTSNENGYNSMIGECPKVTPDRYAYGVFYAR